MPGTAQNSQRNKITISPLEGNKPPIECAFNPTQISHNKSASYDKNTRHQKDTADSTFKGGEPGTLDMTLLFDTSQSGRNVYTEYIRKLLDLLKIEPATATADQSPRPPQLRLQWGRFEFEPYILTKVSTTYTYFLGDGTPVRAKASIGLQELPKEMARQNPTSGGVPRKTWVVVEGETLDWIAYKEYGDPARWREIAEMNDLADPLEIRGGQILKLSP